MSYRTTLDIDADAWGIILVVDPNGLQGAPRYFVLDDAVIQPGLTGKSGMFYGKINDNASERFTRDTPMNLFQADIQKNQEFWIGLQQGSSAPGLANTWTPLTGGRYWVMGGWITERYYQIGADRRITAHIMGADYMDLWKFQPIGTPTTPRNYEDTPTDIYTIINTVFDDVNALQTANYQFTKSSYWPSELFEITWDKEFKLEDAYSIMQNACSELGYEWQIVPYPAGATPAQRRSVMFYPRNGSLASTPHAATPVTYSGNFREAETIQVGSTEDLATDIMATSGQFNTIPPVAWMWAQPGIWMDVISASKEYSMLSSPLPANASTTTNRISDATLVFDMDGNPAVNFQKSDNVYFQLMLAFYTDPAGRPSSSKLNLDLRRLSRIKFNFRHVSRTVNGKYTLRLHNTMTDGQPNEWLNAHISYIFGTGTTQSNYGIGAKDTILNSEWTEIELALPDVDETGAVTDFNGWEENPWGEPIDLTAIDFVSIEVYCPEPLPAWAGSKELEATGAVGSFYLQINDPKSWFLHGPGFVETQDGEVIFSTPRPNAYIAGIDPVTLSHVNSELVVIDAICGEYDGLTNIRLRQPLTKLHLADPFFGLGERLWIPGGYSISLSQFRFEKNPFIVEATDVPIPLQLQNPRRYRMAAFNADSSVEAKMEAYRVLNSMNKTIRKIKCKVDGDPRYLIGSMVDVFLDPERFASSAPDPVFHGVTMFIDDLEYVVVGTDFYCEMTLGELGTQPVIYSQSLLADKVRKNTIGKRSYSTLEAR